MRSQKNEVNYLKFSRLTIPTLALSDVYLSGAIYVAVSVMSQLR